MLTWSFLLGAILVGSWASRDFQSPHALGYIRDRTDFRRYLLGLAVFLLSAWIIYILVWVAASKILQDSVALQHGRGLSAVLTTVLILPNVPWLSRVFSGLRRFAQELAGFPHETDALVLSLRRPNRRAGAVAENLDSELLQFGFSIKHLEQYCSSSSLASILEAQRVHDLLRQCCNGEFGIGGMGWRAARLQRYLGRRQEAILRLDSDYFQLLNRAARVVKLAVDHPLSARQLRQLSGFLADQAENLVARYQKFVAQTALAVFPHGAVRMRFLDYLGYSVPDASPTLPLWPIALVLAIDIGTSGFGFALITHGLGNAGDLRTFAVFIFAHGFSMTAAVLWAIAPKVMWAWARPGRTGRRAVAYAVSALLSYACSFLFFIAALVSVGLPQPPHASMPIPAILLLPPGLFATTSIVLSWRIDRRIMSATYHFGRRAVHDASALLLATILFSVGFRLLAHSAFHMPWQDLPSIWLVWPVLGSTALILGFAIPGWAVRYIYPSGSDFADGNAPEWITATRTLPTVAKVSA
jgi:hypothetical protein